MRLWSTKGRITAAASIVFVALCVWFGFHLEYQPIKETVPPSPLAAANPYLGAERMLQAMGVEVKTHMGLLHDFNPAHGDTVLIPASRVQANPAAMDKLLSWVMHDQGHLHVVAMVGDERQGDGDTTLQDPFLEPLGFGADGEEDTLLASILLDLSGQLGFTPDMTRWELSTREQPALLGPPAGVSLWLWSDHPFSEFDWALRCADDNNIRAITLAVGDGLLSVTADSYFMHNRFLNYGDNAVLLWDMVSLQGDLGTVHIIARVDGQGMFSIVWANARELVIALAVLLALWLWARIIKFGPWVRSELHARRRLLEHVDASGRFLWRAKKGNTLLLAAQREVERVVAQRTAYAFAVGTDSFNHFVHTRSGLDMRFIKRAMNQSICETNAVDAATFVQIMADLERIRKAL